MKKYISSVISALKKRTPVVLAVLVLVATSSAVYLYMRPQGSNAGNNQNSQADIKALVAQIGQLIVLPQGEDPTVATVVDPEHLKDQPFFANAKKGDKVLIYTNEKKAILYNPGSNKIVEVAPVNIGNPPPPPPAQQPAPTTSTSKNTKPTSTKIQ